MIPTILWHQTQNTIELVVQINNAQDIKAKILDDEHVTMNPFFLFKCKTTNNLNENIMWDFHLLLFDLVDKNNIIVKTNSRNINISLNKLKPQLWKKLNMNDEYKNYIKMNWNKYSIDDEYDNDEESNDEEDECDESKDDNMDLDNFMKEIGLDVDDAIDFNDIKELDDDTQNMCNEEDDDLSDCSNDTQYDEDDMNNCDEIDVDNILSASEPIEVNYNTNHMNKNDA